MSSSTSLVGDGLGISGSTGTLPASSPPTSGSNSQLPSTSAQPQPTRRAGLVPTNTVTLKDGTPVRTRIEATLAVEDVVRQLLINLRIKDQPSRYALRDENDELVTNENLRKKILGKVNLK